MGAANGGAVRGRGHKRRRAFAHPHPRGGREKRRRVCFFPLGERQSARVRAHRDHRQGDRRCQKNADGGGHAQERARQKNGAQDQKLPQKERGNGRVRCEFSPFQILSVDGGRPVYVYGERHGVGRARQSVGHLRNAFRHHRSGAVARARAYGGRPQREIKRRGGVARQRDFGHGKHALYRRIQTVAYQRNRLQCRALPRVPHGGRAANIG